MLSSLRNLVLLRKVFILKHIPTNIPAATEATCRRLLALSTVNLHLARWEPICFSWTGQSQHIPIVLADAFFSNTLKAKTFYDRWEYVPKRTRPWVSRQPTSLSSPTKTADRAWAVSDICKWQLRRDSNPRSPAWQAGALSHLSYEAICMQLIF